MAQLKAARTAQYVMEAEFTFNFSDTMVNTAGNTVDFGKTNLGGAAGKFDIINLPENCVVLGGEVITETAFDTAGFDVTIGDAGSENRYLSSADLKGAGRQALTPTGAYNASNLRMTFSSDDACTTGKMTVRVQYVQPGRANEAVPS